MKYTHPVKLIGPILFGICCAGAAQAQTNAPTSDHQAPAASGNTVPNKPGAYAGTGSINNVQIFIPRQPLTLTTDVVSPTHTVTQVNRSTEYIDGLGRSLETVQWQASPNNLDIITPVTYDVFGRNPYTYLSYSYGSGSSAPATSDGSFKMDPFGEQSSFYSSTYPADQPAYQNEQFYYSHIQYESSPLNRSLKTFAPGNSWAGSEGGSAERSVQMKYLVNSSNDNVQIWTIANGSLTYTNNDITTNIPTTTSTYAVGTLDKTVKIDESGHAIVEFKDHEGHTVMKKVQIGSISPDYSGYSGWLCTYYVYDDLDALRFVISPKAVAQLVSAGNWTLGSDMINELCFRYEYDSRRRMIAKKIPGAAWVFLVYDQRDRLVFSQDGNMRQNNQWIGTLYDVLDRPAQTGMLAYTGTPVALQSYVTANTGNYGSSGLPVTGNTQTGVQADLVISSRVQGLAAYNASNSIAFLPGFSSETNAQFVAQIVSPNPQAFTNASTISDNPIPSGGIFTPLTITNYDDYSATAKSYDNSNNGNLDQGNNGYADPIPATASILTRGLPTSMRVRVIENPLNLAQGNWLETARFYDDKGRLIQAQSDNYKGGTDKFTNRYDFTGNAVCIYSVYNNSSANVTNLRVKINTDFDQSERIMETRQTINDDATKTRVLVHYAYDAMGKQKNRLIGEKTDNTGNPLSGQYLEHDAYAYNIRGWLKGINWNYPTSGPTSSQVSYANNKWFGMDLAYDWGFGANQYTGNIGGMRWMSGGDSHERAFGYGYDAADRLLFGNFNQNFGGVWGQSDPSDPNYTINFNMQLGDGLTASSAYDENGNIKQMQQWGLILNKSSQIDNLQYAYEKGGVSNKLQTVTDLTGTTNNNLGDFTDNNTTGDDYGYDVNGNLVTDKNKRINGSTGVDLTGGGAILYNHLNLPWQISMQNSDGSSKGTITYIYDATGNKLEKRINESASTFNSNTSSMVTTSYLGGVVYQNNVLQFFSHPQGRTRPAITPGGQTDLTTWVYDYFLQDHLGNTRTVLTDQYEQDPYPVASLENNAASLQTEESYYTINPADIVNMSSVPAFAFATNNVYYNNNGNPPYNPNPNASTSAQSASMYKLNGVTGDKTGLGITLRVMAGDVIDIWAKSYYHVNGTITNQNLISPAVNALLTAMAGTPALAGTKATAAALTGSPVTPPELQSLLNNVPSPAGKPKAYINWILFDDQFRPVQSASGVDPVSPSGDVVYTHHQNTSGLQMPSNGYLYIYCSNESNQDVYFDNLQVFDTRGPLLEETHYYPFGLTMQGISDKALKTQYAQNKFRYNGKELQNQEFSDGTGLEEYDYGARLYDSQIGRWQKTDAKSELYFNWSPYCYALNTPNNAIDPDGHLVIFINGFAGSSEQGNSSYWRHTVTKTKTVYYQSGGQYDFMYPLLKNYSWTQTYTESENFDELVMNHFDDKKALYFDGSVGGTSEWMVEPDLLFNGTSPSSSPAFRYYAGYDVGEAQAAAILHSLVRSGGVTESIKVVAHSMGGAFAKGLIQAFVDYAKKHPEEAQGLSITEFDFASFQQNSKVQKAVKGTSLKQYDNKGDNVVGGGLFGSQFATEEGADSRTVDNTPGKGHSIFDFVNQVQNLSEGTYRYINGQFVKQ